MSGTIAVLNYRTAVEAVLMLHSKRTFHGDGYSWTVCAACRQAYPCATVMAIGNDVEDGGS